MLIRIKIVCFEKWQKCTLREFYYDIEILLFVFTLADSQRIYVHKTGFKWPSSFIFYYLIRFFLHSQLCDASFDISRVDLRQVEDWAKLYNYRFWSIRTVCIISLSSIFLYSELISYRFPKYKSFLQNETMTSCALNKVPAIWHLLGQFAIDIRTNLLSLLHPLFRRHCVGIQTKF